MNEQDFNSADNGTDSAEDAARGSAWAALDEAFFAIVDGLFSVGFRSLADSMLGTHDNAAPEHAALDHEAAERRAAMRRHPSARRRF